MKEIKLVLLVLSMSILANAQISSTPKVKVKQLKTAYKAKNIAGAEAFFETWVKTIDQISQPELEALSVPCQEAYKVFEAFYNPLDIAKIGGSEWGDSLYKGIQYAIVQNKVRINMVASLDIDNIILRNIENSSIADSIKRKLLEKVDGEYSSYTKSLYGGIMSVLSSEEDVQADTIENFRPRINIEQLKAVYLTNDYAQILTNFLSNKFIKLGKGGIMNPARATKSSAKKQAFLEKLVTIFQGHWGGYWQLTTYPEVSLILLDEKLENAIIYFRIVYEGGEAYLKKENGDWKIITAKRTWIE